MHQWWSDGDGSKASLHNFLSRPWTEAIKYWSYLCDHLYNGRRGGEMNVWLVLINERENVFVCVRERDSFWIEVWSKAKFHSLWFDVLSMREFGGKNEKNMRFGGSWCVSRSQSNLNCNGNKMAAMWQSDEVLYSTSWQYEEETVKRYFCQNHETVKWKKGVSIHL